MTSTKDSRGFESHRCYEYLKELERPTSMALIALPSGNERERAVVFRSGIRLVRFDAHRLRESGGYSIEEHFSGAVVATASQ